MLRCENVDGKKAVSCGSGKEGGLNSATATGQTNPFEVQSQMSFHVGYKKITQSGSRLRLVMN